ncbi:MAG: trypsin-like serine protease, partial [Blastocatellia bacterium]
MFGQTNVSTRRFTRGLDYLDYEDELEAELGGEYVIGPTDDRFHIPAQRARQFPFSTICFLEADFGDGNFAPWCSGTLVAPQVVLTAKHCLINRPPFAPCSPVSAVGIPLARIRVTPGADLSATR